MHNKRLWRRPKVDNPNCRLAPPSFELGTFCVLGRRDNHYTTEPQGHHHTVLSRQYRCTREGCRKSSKECNVAQWSRGMIRASGARGPGFKSRLSPLLSPSAFALDFPHGAHGCCMLAHRPNNACTHCVHNCCPCVTAALVECRFRWLEATYSSSSSSASSLSKQALTAPLHMVTCSVTAQNGKACHV